MLTKDETEAKIAEGNANRVTEEGIDAVIVGTQFLRVGVLTICVLTLRNGFNVTGESACVDPANYKQDVGDSIAFRNARSKIWLLEGYALAERLRTDMPQSDNVVGQSQQLGAVGSAYTDPAYLRAECLRTAAGVIQSGNVPGGDVVSLAREYYGFLTETDAK